MSEVPAGGVEVVSSCTEQVGLPNWANAKILVSAKTIVAHADFDAANVFLSALVDAVHREHVEEMAKSLNMWAGLDPNSVTTAGQAPWPITPMSNVELTFSMSEQIPLPSPERGQNSNINILQSSKTLVTPGNEIQGYKWLSAGVKKQLNDKRTVVMANPRPWASV